MAVAGFFLLLLWAITVTINRVNGTWCYTCHVTPLSNDCMTDPAGLLNSRLDVESILDNNGTSDDFRGVRYVGNCTDSQPFCVIEEIVVDGDTKLFYRDCSDGQKFSIETNGTRLDEQPHDNITHCTFSYKLEFKGLVCFTLCRGDFCNGPLSAGNIIMLDTLAACFLVAYFFLVKCAL